MSEAIPPAESVVVIDDDYAMRMSCRKILAKMGLGVETFDNGAQGLEGVARLKPDAVVVDLKMPGLSGLEVVSRVHESDPNIVVVVITGFATIDTAVEAMKKGAYDFLPKPFTPDELRLIVNRGLERRHLALATQQHEVERGLMKRRFVTFVSHQLQTPLVAIHQYLDVLRHADSVNAPAEQRSEWLDRCLIRTEELQHIIKDWLTLAKVEGDALCSQRVKVDLHQIIEGILATYCELAASEKVTLESALPATPLCVAGDPNCLSVVFDNLITNAIKYNRSGGKVMVSGKLAAGETVISVTDTGIGIPEQYRPFLFEEFFRVKGEGAKKTSGTGLGLHITRKIVTEMGGVIGVDSEAWAGSTFTVRLPAYVESKPATEAELAVKGANL
jgi:two-component system sensor histidine kinase/response regulator